MALRDSITETREISRRFSNSIINISNQLLHCYRSQNSNPLGSTYSQRRDNTIFIVNDHKVIQKYSSSLDKRISRFLPSSFHYLKSTQPTDVRIHLFNFHSHLNVLLLCNQHMCSEDNPPKWRKVVLWDKSYPTSWTTTRVTWRVKICSNGALKERNL